MADNTPSTATPASTTPRESLADLRQGIALVSFLLALLLAGVLVYLVVNAPDLGAAEKDVETTWMEGFKSRKVWPVLVWSGVFSLVCTGGALMLMQKRGPEADDPRHLAPLLAGMQLAFALMLALVPVFLLATRGLQIAIGPVFLWAAALAVVLMLGGLLLVASPQEDVGRFRLALLSVGGAAGFLTVLLGFLLPILTYGDTLSRGLEEWRKNWDAVLWPNLGVFGGLALMFASLQLGRGLERRNQTIRRLIYGFNTVLTGLLLVSVLTLPNVLAYAEPFTRFFGRPFDWTKDNVNSISDELRNVLSELREDVAITLLMPREDRFEVSQNTQTLLDHCRSLSPRITWQLLSPTDPKNRETISEMMRKYSIGEPHGMLLVVGKEGTKEGSKTDHVFIKFEQLYREDMGMGRERAAPTLEYLGENVLVDSLTSLTEGKAVLYFTQGHGELKMDSAPPMMAPRKSRNTDSISELTRRLGERRSVQIQPLDLSKERKVPDDATVVVVARPTQPFSPEALDALGAYASRNEVKDDKTVKVTAGKLMILLDPTVRKQADGSVTMQETGLEGLLLKHKVRVGNDRVLTFGLQDPLMIVCQTPANSPNPVARAFDAYDLVLQNTRSISPATREGDPSGGGVDVLLQAIRPDQRTFVWAESNLSRSPNALVESLLQNREQLIKIASGKPVPVALAISDSSGPDIPRDRAHAPVLKGAPRMVVFGSASWVSDEGLSSRQSAVRVDLFSSCLSWLRGSAAMGTKKGRVRSQYELGVNVETQANRLRFLPLGLMVLGVVGLGTGVWVVRRR